MNRNLSNCEIGEKKFFGASTGFQPVAISQLLKLRFTAMVTYSFHLHSRSSHHFILCYSVFNYFTAHRFTLQFKYLLVRWTQSYAPGDKYNLISVMWVRVRHGHITVCPDFYSRQPCSVSIRFRIAKLQKKTVETCVEISKNL